MSGIPELRIRAVNEAPLREERGHVLYWMIANRRTRWNFALERAVSRAAELDRPLIILEALRCGYRWASDRLHRFVLQGMADNRASLADLPVRYYPYVEPEHGAGSGLLQALGRDACVVGASVRWWWLGPTDTQYSRHPRGGGDPASGAGWRARWIPAFAGMTNSQRKSLGTTNERMRPCVVVTDDYPCFFLPQMITAAGRKLDVRLETVDSNGLLPLRAADKVFARAYDFRRWLQKHLEPHLSEMPKPAPFQGYRLREAPSIPQAILERWPEATAELLQADPATLATLPIDHGVGPASFDGGLRAAQACLDRFLDDRLDRYAQERNDPDAEAASGLSPYLHFGHICVHEVFAAITRREHWSPASLAEKSRGARQGWWGMSEQAESFLDELITWRELGFNMCWQTDDYDKYDSLPEWARQTLAEHAEDEREHIYSLEEFEQARTHDELWNAAQRQLLREGRMHNYLRMPWGKKVLEWSATPQEALETLIHLNNKYAVDGRDPNSWSGVFWVFGRYDRAWGPERPIFGKVRYMSSDNTARKLRLDGYLERYGLNSSVGRT